MWEKLRTFLSDVRGEFGRVIWPTREDLVSSTTVVLVFSGVFAVFIGLFDLVLSFVRSLMTSL